MSVLPEKIPLVFYDELGEGKFKDLINQIAAKEYGAKNFYPGPSKGKDGGIDSRKLTSGEVRIIWQFKWREVARYDRSKLLSGVKSDFEKELEKIKNEDDIKYFFVTNVCLTQTYHELFTDIIKKYENIEIEYWEFEKINFYLIKYDDLVVKFFPSFSRQQYQAIKAENRKLKKRFEETIASKEFIDIKYKFKELFISNDLRKKYLYPVIYLVSPLRANEQDSATIKIICELFGIDQELFTQLIGELETEKLVTKTGALIYVANVDNAKQALSNLLKKADFAVDQLISMIGGLG